MKAIAKAPRIAEPRAEYTLPDFLPPMARGKHARRLQKPSSMVAVKPEVREPAMRCHECGGTYRTRKGTLRLPDDVVKLLVIPDVEYLECDECGELMFPLDTAKKIGDTRDRMISELLRSRPTDEFISATDAAAMLGISRQALQRHRRISRGFVYQRREGGKTMYLKDSVRQFKETGDGRIPLSVSPDQPHC